jgi:hypothetical protein
MRRVGLSFSQKQYPLKRLQKPYGNDGEKMHLRTFSHLSIGLALLNCCVIGRWWWCLLCDWLVMVVLPAL